MLFVLRIILIYPGFSHHLPTTLQTNNVDVVLATIRRKSSKFPDDDNGGDSGLRIIPALCYLAYETMLRS